MANMKVVKEGHPFPYFPTREGVARLVPLFEAAEAAIAAWKAAPAAKAAKVAAKAAITAFRAAEKAEAADPGIGQTCFRCGGRGFFGPACVFGGVCFDCGRQTIYGTPVPGSGIVTASARNVRAPLTETPEEESKRIRKMEAFVAEKAAKEAAKAEKRAAALAALSPAARELLAHPTSDFFRSLAEGVDKYGSLTPRQVEALEAAAVRDAARKVERDAQAASAAAAGPIAAGRREVSGRILSVKEKETDFGITVKMLVLADNGHKFYGTVPSNIVMEAKAGDRVTLTATVEPSATDPAFAFLSRPTKAVLTPAEAPADAPAA